MFTNTQTERQFFGVFLNNNYRINTNKGENTSIRKFSLLRSICGGHKILENKEMRGESPLLTRSAAVGDSRAILRAPTIKPTARTAFFLV